MTTKVVYKEYKHYLYHMIKDFTTYQQALKLKALGFDEPCFGRWWFNAGIHKLNEEELEIIKSYYFGLPEYYILAPTFSQAFRFFREKYQIFPEVLTDCTTEPKFVYTYKTFYGNPKDLTEQEWGWENNIGQYSDLYRTYEEAELACLNKLITLIK